MFFHFNDVKGLDGLHEQQLGHGQLVYELHAQVELDFNDSINKQTRI